MKTKSLFLAVAVALGAGVSALANNPSNQPPPAGALLDLNGTPIPGGGDGITYQLYTVDFTAALTSTDITFAFREDPAFISFNEASVVDLTTSSSNLLTNGNFLGGVYCSNGNCATPIGWTYANVFGATFGGVVSTGCAPDPFGNTTCWFDGAVQAYDAIDQFIGTTVGDQYQISFYVADDSNCSTDGGPPCNFSALSTNGDVTDTGGNGIDVLAYAQAGLPPPGVPEPATLFLLGSGLVGIAARMRRRKPKA